MNYYCNEYLRLQQDTLPVAQDLNSYTALQVALLPIIVPDEQAGDTDFPMSLFLETNTPLVTQYKEKAVAQSNCL